MEWRVEVQVLTIKDFLQEKLDLVFEVFENGLVFFLVHQVLELTQNAIVFPWVKLPFFLGFEELEFKELRQKKVICFHLVNVNVEECFNAFETLGELTHCPIVNGIPAMRILLTKDLSVPVDQVTSI